MNALPGRPTPSAEKGSVSAEVAIATPALMILILLAVQFGLWYHASNVARAAAQEGVRAARVEGATAADGQEEAQRFLAEAGSKVVESSDVASSRDASSARVEVRGTAAGVIPGIHLPLRAVAQSPVEVFRGMP